MDKRRALVVSAVHFVWAVGLCLGAYYVEIGIMNVFMQWGVAAVVLANIVIGILLFLGFSAMEKKLIAQDLSKPILFVFSTYMMPFAYQWIMLVRINEMYGKSDSDGLILSIVFTFTWLLMGMGLFLKAMLTLSKFVKSKMQENQTQVTTKNKRKK